VRTAERRVADQDVELAVALVQRAGEAGDSLVVPHLQRDQRRGAADGFDGVVELFKAAGRARGCDHMRALARERDCQRITDAARAAGDQRDAGGKRFGHARRFTTGYGEAAVSEAERTCCCSSATSTRRRRTRSPGYSARGLAQRGRWQTR